MNKHFRPGTFGYHELLDRAYLISSMFDAFVSCHPARKHPKLKKRIKRLNNKLSSLYVEIGNIVGDCDANPVI